MKAFVDLGFKFSQTSSEGSQVTETLPALTLFKAVETAQLKILNSNPSPHRRLKSRKKVRVSTISRLATLREAMVSFEVVFV